MPRQVDEMMDLCLKKGAEARKYSIALGTQEYSGEIVQQLMKFSQKMENVFKNLQQLVAAKTEDQGKFLKFFKIIEDKMAWYEKAEAWSSTWHGIVLDDFNIWYRHVILISISEMRVNLHHTKPLRRTFYPMNTIGAPARCRMLQKLCRRAWSPSPKKPQRKPKRMRVRVLLQKRPEKLPKKHWSPNGML